MTQNKDLATLNNNLSIFLLVTSQNLPTVEVDKGKSGLLLQTDNQINVTHSNLKLFAWVKIEKTE
ncbi:hypothetical protein GS682_13610 [Nostoc sp. B(2019)]|nr:hypothetical protein [Nostoc sp. B(2019)]